MHSTLKQFSLNVDLGDSLILLYSDFQSASYCEYMMNSGKWYLNTTVLSDEIHESILYIYIFIHVAHICHIMIYSSALEPSHNNMGFYKS